MIRRVPEVVLAAALAGCAAEARDTNVTVRRESVVDGQPSSADPSVVAMVLVPLECGVAERLTFCTGTLIAPRVVLTAAHCLGNASPATMKVYVGADVERMPGEWLPVRAFRSHPGWDGKRNDLGALILEADATTKPSKVRADYAPTPSERVRVVGFGIDDAGRVGGKRSGTARVTTFEDTVFGIEASPAMTCPGDSGGPVFLERDGVEELVGVTSYGDAECRIGINTRIAAFREFLDGVVAEAARLPPGPRPQLDRAIDSCAQSCVSDQDCPREMRCTPRENGALRCALAGLPPASLTDSCDAVTGCRKERCISLASASIPGAPGECRCYHECDAPLEEPTPKAETPVIRASGGGCGVGTSAMGPSAGLGVIAAALTLRRRKSSKSHQDVVKPRSGS